MLGSVAAAFLQVFFNVGFAPPLVEFLARPLFGDGAYVLREDVRIFATVFCVWFLQGASLFLVMFLTRALSGKTVFEWWDRIRSKN